MPARVQLAHNSQGRPPLHGGKPPGVAVRVETCRHHAELLEQVGAAGGQTPVRRDVFVRHRLRLSDDGGGAFAEAGEHAPHGPGQVDGGWTGGRDTFRLPPHVLGTQAVTFGLLRRDRHAERARHSDRRSPSHHEAADGVDHRVDVTHLDHDDVRREARLIDHDGVVAAPLDRAHQRDRRIPSL